MPVRLAATRLAVSRLPPGDRRACANEADEKVNIYESLASLHHSRVIFANPAWIKVAERSGVCLERRVRRMQRLNMVMPPPLSLCRRDVQLDADFGGGELRHGGHRHADAERHGEQPPLHPHPAGSHPTQWQR